MHPAAKQGLPTSAPVHPLQRLQRALGNQAMGRFIQAKLEVNQPGDMYEQEADRVADQVMRMPVGSEQLAVDSGQLSGVRREDGHIQRMCTECEDEEEELVQAKALSGQITPLVQRQEEGKELLQTEEAGNSHSEVSTELEASINNIRGGGQQLPDSVRAQRKTAAGLIQRQPTSTTETPTTETPTTETQIPHLTLGTSSLFQTSTGPDFLAMRQPFFNRSIAHLWDPDSALQVWQYNFSLFRRFGLSPDLSTTLTNFTAPRFIDSQLKAGNPSWWEITDRELNTTSFVGLVPGLEFTPNFSPVAPSWLRSIFHAGGSSVQRKCATCEAEEKQMQLKESETGVDNVLSIENYVGSLNGKGTALSNQEKDFFESRFDVDFSDVKIHSDEEAAASAQSINALAFTHENNIVFGSNQFHPETDTGKRLMAHELMHTIQQKQMAGQSTQRFVQRTTIGEILDEFFSPFSTKTLWNMSESDNYTVIVRAWQPVIDGLNLTKQNIATDCAAWSATHRSSPGWSPGLNAIPDANSDRRLVKSPPGTDPATCRNAFIVYQGSRAISPFTPIQTQDLYTCSIGSFSLAVTVNSIDCAARTADINVWMYNVMSQSSFGKYTRYFPLSGMENQYMWWNWDETITWTGPGTVTTLPERRSDWGFIGDKP